MFAPRSFARVSQSYAEDRRLATGIDINVPNTHVNIQIDLYNIRVHYDNLHGWRYNVLRSLTFSNASLPSGIIDYDIKMIERRGDRAR